MDRPVRDGDAPAVPAGRDDEPVTVLHVEDDPSVAERAAAFLERSDDRIGVRTVASGDDALERLGEGGVDCIVSGHDPPGTDALELLRAVRESHGDVPFVLFARDGDELLASEAIAAGVTHYVPNRENRENRENQENRVNRVGTDGYERLVERVTEAVWDRRSRRGDGARTDERRRERALASLHDATRELMTAASESDIADLAVRTARDILGMPVTGCWLYDERADALVPVASTDESDSLVGEPPTYREGEGLSWAAFEAGESRVYADLSERSGRYNPETPVRSEIVLPLGEHGVLNVGSTEVDAFDEADFSLARVLAANTEAALDRADREQRLRAQRELVDAAVDALDDVFCVFDADGELVRWNDRFVESTGYTGEGLAGKPLSECIAPEDRDRVVSTAGDLHRTGRTRIEADLRTSDGERIPYEFTASALAGGTDGPSGFVVVGRDVTERRERLRELERYEGIVEASGDPVYTLDADGRFTFVNDALVETVGHDEAILLGSHVSVVMDPADVERVEEVIGSLLSSTDDRATVETPIHTAEGDRIPCEAHITVLPFEEEERFRGTVGVVRDVSDRIEHVRKLEALQERTQALMHTRTRSETGRVAADTAEEVLGIDLVGFNLLDDGGDALVPVATLDRVRETFDEPPTYRRDSGAETDRVVWEVFEDGEPLVIDDTREYGGLAEETPARSAVLHPLADHGVLVVSSTEVDAFDEADAVLVEILATALTAALDRVERETLLRERESQLERQNERLEEFASVVSHDLRNPLNVAMASLDFARETCDADELETVADAHDRMEALIADLLELAREGDAAAEMAPVALAETAERCWQSVETTGATLRVETDRRVVADESRLCQLLENLVRNSVEHGSTSPRSRAREESMEHSSTGSRTQSGDVAEDASASNQRPTGADDAVEPRARRTSARDARGDAAERDVRQLPASDAPGNGSGHGAVDGPSEPGRSAAHDRGGVTVTIGDLEDGFYVEDDGPGIPEDERDRVFEAGYSRNDDGTGFGLKIVADAARRQGWEVAVAEGADGGARFEVTGVEFDRQ